MVGPLNDRAYGFGTDSFTRALRNLPSDGIHVYVASDDGEPIGCLLMTDHGDNSDVECVAVVPEARGRGISGHLLGHALADAAERGIRTSTLVSTGARLSGVRARRLPPVRPLPDVGARGGRRLSQTTSTDSSNMTSPSSTRCTGHLAPICMSRSRWSSGSSLGKFTVIVKRVGEPRWAGS